MPVVFRHKGIRFFFYANEGNPREPLHIHIQRGECLAKFWLEPEITLDNSYGFNSAELNNISKLLITKKYIIKEAWDEYFN